MKISCADCTIELIREDPGYDPASADNSRRYDATCKFGECFSSAHGIRVSRNSTPLANTIVLAEGGGTGIHEHSALIIENALFLAAGAYVVRLSLPYLNLVWARDVDHVTCFGIHAVPGSTDFIFHGEMQIARLTDSGAILWANGGSDIFTGSLKVTSNTVIVNDFNDDLYRFDLLSGACLPADAM